MFGIEVCSAETATVTLTLEGEDRLDHVSGDAGAGHPEGELTRVE
ncbi:hypothetical protein [Streptomyces sp. URMC 125]